MPRYCVNDRLTSSIFTECTCNTLIELFPIVRFFIVVVKRGDMQVWYFSLELSYRRMDKRTEVNRRAVLGSLSKYIPSLHSQVTSAARPQSQDSNGRYLFLVGHAFLYVMCCGLSMIAVEHSVASARRGVK